MKNYKLRHDTLNRIGLYDKVKQLLSNSTIIELGGIEANPKINSVRHGVKLCKEHNVDVILAVGGGSVIDCSKAIAAAVYYDGDAWYMIKNKIPIEKALPICTVTTLAATGSETDAGAIIVNQEVKEKCSLFGSEIMPKISIIDPCYTFSVPENQTAAGCADIMSHLMEQYFISSSTYMNDMLVESVMKTIIHYARTTMDEPENYEARGQILWASEIADNGTLSNGSQIKAFAVHSMEHQLSGRFNTTHGVGLAIITPRWMKYILSDKTVERFAHFGKAVWGINASLDKYEIANKAIEATAAFFKSLDIPQSLRELGVDDTQFEEMAKLAEQEGTAYAWVPLTAKDIMEIYKMCI